jgi:hypothetical protein
LENHTVNFFIALGSSKKDASRGVRNENTIHTIELFGTIVI